ncbi:hypothetical protein FISHEDRAFT_55252 [Fistulina hepatica ATCC 64428]|uniref:Uncharacterized protein n=1 Tax=Fistulina hepatica ATCC 64428 TaxID=1128425 RepID=A0A0D7ANF2_9AGAR|nr:hypothetical protein FISHEDRAFT_55252 [Fistulina hepatica ATCC 64428]
MALSTAGAPGTWTVAQHPTMFYYLGDTSLAQMISTGITFENKKLDALKLGKVDENGARECRRAGVKLSLKIRTISTRRQDDHKYGSDASHITPTRKVAKSRIDVKASSLVRIANVLVTKNPRLRDGYIVECLAYNVACQIARYMLLEQSIEHRELCRSMGLPTGYTEDRE